MQILTTRPKWKNNVRLMQVGALDDQSDGRQFRFIKGGVLVQDADLSSDPEDQWEVVTEQSPSDAANMIPLAELPALLDRLLSIRDAIKPVAMETVSDS